MSGHTKGPWMVHDTIDGPILNTDVRDMKLKWVARCGPLFGRPHVAESEANARLIASAPELMEALQSIADLGSDGEHSGDRHARCRDIARKAIARVTQP